MSEQRLPRLHVTKEPLLNLSSTNRSTISDQRHVKVTIVSLAESKVARGSGQEDIPRFMTGEMTAKTATELPGFLRAQTDLSSGVIIIIIEGWQSWLATALQEALPSFPTSFLDEFVTNREITMLPRFEGRQDMSSVMEHVDVLPKSMIEGQPSSIWGLGEYVARRIPLATWVHTEGNNASSPSRPIIVISGDQGFDIRQKVMSHYCVIGPRRWSRLNDMPYWIYLDIFYIFTKWDRTWEAVRGNLEELEKQIYTPGFASSTLYQTRRLHRDTGTTLALRESIRLHAASFKRFSFGMEKLGKSAEFLSLHERLDDVSQLLEYYELTSSTILEQQQNLLSLIFNTDAMNQGKAIGRITAMGFFFLPLSYVASLWGITTWKVEAQWYPAAAIPVLVITITAAILVNKFATDRELVKLYPRQQVQAPQDPPQSNANASITVDKPIEKSTAEATTSFPLTVSPSFNSYDPEPTRNRPSSRTPPRTPPRGLPRMRYPVRSSFTEERYEQDDSLEGTAPAASGAVLSGRTRVVSRVDSDSLHPSSYDEESHWRSFSYRNAAMGATNAPSGMLRHNV